MFQGMIVKAKEELRLKQAETLAKQASVPLDDIGILDYISVICHLVEVLHLNLNRP
ncbi:hypothetical protein DPMN_194200 [Dreissena polymorpha]|uniref:Uncharacterized protein n=1 Tax=Dreissena polymorpha TaxID=45954 RepID=A0A9D3Y1N4_DREPO|nr:hypothetical protein DPMN_194200 [Dreissena polymorpha]